MMQTMYLFITLPLFLLLELHWPTSFLLFLMLQMLLYSSIFNIDKEINVFRNYMDALAEKQLELTLGYLATGKPVFQVNITYAAVSSPSTTGVTKVADSVKGNAAAAISSVIIGIFLVVAGSVGAYFGYQKYYAPAPVVKKQPAAKKPVEEKRTNHVELQEIEEEREEERKSVQLEDV